MQQWLKQAYDYWQDQPGYFQCKPTSCLKDVWSNCACQRCEFMCFKREAAANIPREMAAASHTNAIVSEQSIWLLAGSTRLLPMQSLQFSQRWLVKLAVFRYTCQPFADNWFKWRLAPNSPREVAAASQAKCNSQWSKHMTTGRINQVILNATPPGLTKMSVQTAKY